MKSLEQCDFSAQETMHHLMSLKLVSSTFNVVPISLNGSRRIKTYTPDGNNVTNDRYLIPMLSMKSTPTPFLT